MLRVLKELCFTTKPKIDDLVCDGKGWINRSRNVL